MELEEFLTDAGFILVITGLLAATFTYQYIGSCDDVSYLELHEVECGVYEPLFYAGVIVGVVGFLMVAVTVLRKRRSKPPDMVGESHPKED